MADPFPGRVESLARKAVEQGLREVHQAPEQRQARRLRRDLPPPTPQPDAPHVAFLVPRSWASDVQWSSLLARGLETRGARVSLIACGGGLPLCDRITVTEGFPPPCRTCRGYTEPSVRAHGFDPTLLRTDWDHPGGPVDEWPELDGLSLAELLDVTAEGLPLGRLVDIPVRWYLRGGSLAFDPLQADTTRRFLRAARRIAHALTAELDRLRPDTLVLVNGLFSFEAIAKALAEERGIDVVSYERGFIHNTLFFRRGLPAASYDIEELWQRWRDVPLTAAQAARVDDYLASRRRGETFILRYSEDGEATVEPAPAGRVAVLFTNITWDSAVIGKEIAYPDLLEWIVDTIGYFRHRPADRLVIRIHPAEIKLPGEATREPLEPLIRDRVPDLPANVTIVAADDRADSYQLMDQADVGLVFTSTTGLELALMGVPTVVCGETHYRGKGFTVDASSPEDHRAILDRLLADPGTSPVDLDAARRYSYTFFFRALIDSTFVTEPVRGIVRLAVRTPAALGPGGHPSIDRLCDFILSRDPLIGMEGPDAGPDAPA